MVIYGLDISNGQGAVDFAAVAGWRGAAGERIRFVIAKATEGHTYLDPYYLANKKAITAAGLVPGAYHFLRPLNGAAIEVQADWFCEWADPAAMHCLDVEAAGPLDVRGWVARYRKRYPTKKLWIYTGPDLWKSTSGVGYDAAPFGPLWAAGDRPNHYVPTDGLDPAQSWAKVTGNAGLPWLGYTTWSIMQYASGKAKVPGVHTEIDLNVFGGTEADLRRLANGDEPMALDAADKAWLHGEVAAQLAGLLAKLDDAIWTYPVGKSGYNAVQVLQRAHNQVFALPVPATAADIADAVAARFTGATGADLEAIKKAVADVISSYAWRAGAEPATS